MENNQNQNECKRDGNYLVFFLHLRFMSYKLLFVDNNYADEIRLDRMRVLHA